MSTDHWPRVSIKQLSIDHDMLPGQKVKDGMDDTYFCSTQPRVSVKHIHPFHRDQLGA